MPSCCIKRCRSRSSGNHLALTFHRFPVNESLRNKWLEIIGDDNINPRLKAKFVCSVHFDESSFNRTLDVVRLRDGAVPSSSLLISVLKEGEKLIKSTTLPCEELRVKKNTNDETFKQVSNETIMVERGVPSTSTVPEKVNNIRLKKLTFLTERCDYLKKKVKSLNEKVRRRDKMLAIFSNIITDLQKRNLLKDEESLIFEECAVSEKFLKKQIAKATGVPQVKTTSRKKKSMLNK